MQPSSPTYARACHSRPFPLRFWPQGTHSASLTAPLKVTSPHSLDSSLPLERPCASVPPCLLSLSLCLSLCCPGFWGCCPDCLALHALFAVFFPLLPAARHVGEGGEGSWLRGRAGVCPLLQVGLNSCSSSGNFCSICEESEVRDAQRAFPGQGKGKGNDGKEFFFLKKRRACVHVEVTPEKMEHMCMCERTRWERMGENLGTPKGSCS